LHEKLCFTPISFSYAKTDLRQKIFPAKNFLLRQKWRVLVFKLSGDPNLRAIKTRQKLLTKFLGKIHQNYATVCKEHCCSGQCQPNGWL